jgi:hypothetical protein
LPEQSPTQSPNEAVLGDSLDSLRGRFDRSIRVPAAVVPRASLVERFDDESGLQHVEVIMTMPLLGRVYEYAGFFRYEVRAGESAQ